jgi:hypothetical protein
MQKQLLGKRMILLHFISQLKGETNMTFIRCEFLTVAEALKLEHLGFYCKLIKMGDEKDLYNIYTREG